MDLGCSVSKIIAGTAVFTNTFVEGFLAGYSATGIESFPLSMPFKNLLGGCIAGITLEITKRSLLAPFLVAGSISLIHSYVTSESETEPKNTYTPPKVLDTVVKVVTFSAVINTAVAFMEQFEPPHD